MAKEKFKVIIDRIVDDAEQPREIELFPSIETAFVHLKTVFEKASEDIDAGEGVDINVGVFIETERLMRLRFILDTQHPKIQAAIKKLKPLLEKK